MATMGTSGRIYYGWIVVAVCIAILAPISIVLDGFSLLYVSVLDEFKWNRGDVALAMTIHMIVSGAASPFAGGLLDRYGPKVVMPVGAALTAIGYVWMGRSTALWHFYLAFGVMVAVGSSMLYFTPMTALISNWFVRHRGAAIGAMGVGQSVGQVRLPVLQYLIITTGWRGASFSIGALILLAPSALALLFLSSRPEDRGLSRDDERLPWAKREREAEQTDKREVVILDKAWAETEWTIRKASRTSRFWMMLLVMAFYAAGTFIITVQLAAFLVDKGYGAVMAASVMSVQGLMNLVGKFAGGVLCDRIGRERTFTLTVTLFIASIALLGLSGVFVHPVVAYTCAVVFGLAAGSSVPCLMTSAADLFEGKHFGSILGVIMLGGWAAGGLGAWLGGYLFDVTRGYAMNFVVALIVMATAAVLIWRAGPGRIRQIRSVA